MNSGSICLGEVYLNSGLPPPPSASTNGTPSIPTPNNSNGISPGLINSRSNSNSTNINNINNNNINTRTLTHTNPTILDPDPDPSPDTGWDGMGEIDLKEDINGI